MQAKRKKAFTIIEILTILSVIVVLMSLVLPALNKVRRFAAEVKQKRQFYTLRIAIGMFEFDNSRYPPSDAFDGTGISYNYCGAMKFTEAMIGQDLLGFHPDADFLPGNQLYIPPYQPDRQVNLGRRTMFVGLEGLPVSRLDDIYGIGETGTFLSETIVICDVFRHTARSGKQTGMPILYYRANQSNMMHDANSPINFIENIYNYNDNKELIALGSLTGEIHPLDELAAPEGKHVFYDITRNPDIFVDYPYRPKSFILMSAGFDGLYGTPDDIYNFEGK